jgi:hypothetical protein
VYMCNTCFSDAMIQKIMKRLATTCPRLRYVFTVKSLPDHPLFRLHTSFVAPASWSDHTTAYIYEIRRDSLSS